MTLKEHYHVVTIAVAIAFAFSVFFLIAVGIYLSLIELLFHPDYMFISKEHPELLKYDALTLLRATRAVQYKDPSTRIPLFIYSFLLAIVFVGLIWTVYNELRWIWHLRKLKSKLER